MKKVLAVFFTIIFIFSLNGCKKRRRRRRFRVSYSPVKVLKIKKSNVKQRILLTGNIKGIEEVNIYSYTTGILKRKFVTEGQRVYKGQALFSIDQTIRGQDIRDYVIVSPLTGIISDIQMDIGALIIGNQSIIAKVFKTNVLKADVYISEADINKIKIGNRAIIKVEAAPNNEFKGKITKISPIINLNNRTAKVEILIQRHNNLLKSGMFAEVEILTDIISGKILVPFESVIQEDNTTYVFKLDKNKKRAVKQIVRVGFNYSGNLIIEQGLKEGDLVIIEGQYQVFDGFPVKILNSHEINF